MKWTKDNMPNQNGKTVLVTGATSGIGYEIALALYQKGARVILASKDNQKLGIAKQRLEKLDGGGIVEIARLDLASLSQIADFSAHFIKAHRQLDVLINNAGVMTPPASLTQDGFESQFGINFLGHFALTAHLYSLLKSTKNSRVVTLSSGAHKMVDRINFDNLKSIADYDAQREYAVSKLADLQFMVALARRSGHSPISVAAHPGVSETNLSRFMSDEDFQQGLKNYGPLMPAWQGALPALYASVAADVSSGQYFGPDGANELNGYPAPAVLSEAARDKTQTDLLWKYAQKATGLVFP